jgi:translocation and assembly module TamA
MGISLLAVQSLAQLADEDDTPAPPAAAPAPQTLPAPEAGPAPLEVPYQVAIDGQLDAGLRSLLEQVSEARQQVDAPPTSITRLRRRAENDVPKLQQALRSRGYYDSRVGVGLDERARPVRVVFDVQPGPLYRLGRVQIATDQPAPALTLPAPEALGLAEGSAAAAQAILDAEAALLERVKAQGYALAEMGQRQVVVDHDERTMEVTYNLEPGPHARFGPITIDGLETVERPVVERRLGWEEGELITPEKLQEARRRLIETGLFRSVDIALGTSAAETARVPVRLELGERRHRSIGIGVRYRTDEGPGGNIFWEHRNFFGQGEELSVEVDGSGLGFRFGGAFRKPDFLRLDQAFIADAETRIDDTEAFQSTSFGASAGLERIFAPGLIGSLSLAFRYLDIDDLADDEGDEQFGLLSLPATLSWDTSDDLLDPTRGSRLALDEEPFVDVLGSGVIFNKALASYTHYLQVFDDPRVILAGRAAVGSIFGAEREDIPADERFYAGGGGSVRGFGFQKGGELDDDGDPLGGRSLLELAGEVRFNITDTVGGVAFLDAGAAFSSNLPDFSEELRFGTGVGLRYFSPIGPVRFDVGFPINRRDEDDAFQIYISLGQAF